MMQPGRALWPELFDWQLLFLAYLTGIYSHDSFWAALTAFLLLRLVSFPRMFNAAGHLLWMSCFIAGYLAMYAGTPALIDTPDWMERGETVQVRGTVVSSTTAMGARQVLVLDDLRCRTSYGLVQQLPGRLRWTIEKREQRFYTGRDIEVSLRVRPVRGFINPGVEDSGKARRHSGILYQAFSGGQEEIPWRYAGASGGFWSRLSEKSQDLRAVLKEKALKVFEGVPDDDFGRALVMSLLFGDRYYLDAGFYDLVSRASLAHTLALSGLHLGLLVMLAAVLVKLFGYLFPRVYYFISSPKLTVCLALPMILAFLWLVQGSPSLYRSALMFACFALMVFLNRGQVLIDGLFLALLIILVVSPSSAFEVSLQLSALAVAGVAAALRLLAPAHAFVDEKLACASRPAGRNMPLHAIARFALVGALDIVVVSLVVSLFIMPLESWYFNRITPNFFFNLLWLPILGLLIMPLALFGILCLALPFGAPLGTFLLTVCASLLNKCAWALQYFDALGLVRILVTWRSGWLGAIGYWLLLAVFMWMLGSLRRKEHPVKIQAKAVLVLAVGMIFLAAPHLEGFFRNKNGLSILLFDVGQGQSILLETASGRRVLIDGGGMPFAGYDVGRQLLTPALTWRHRPQLDYVIYSHPDYDHLDGLLYPLAEFRVCTLAGNGRRPSGEEGRVFERVLRERKIFPEFWHKGRVVEIEPGLKLEVLWPGPILEGEGNNYSLVMRLVWEGRGMAVFPGDVDQKTLDAIMHDGADLSAQVLVLPHHGSRNALNGQFYAAVGPKIALASAGYMNRWGHPAREVREALYRQGVPLLSTSRHGYVRLRWSTPQALPDVETGIK